MARQVRLDFNFNRDDVDAAARAVKEFANNLEEAEKKLESLNKKDINIKADDNNLQKTLKLFEKITRFAAVLDGNTIKIKVDTSQLEKAKQDVEGVAREKKNLEDGVNIKVKADTQAAENKLKDLV